MSSADRKFNTAAEAMAALAVTFREVVREPHLSKERQREINKTVREINARTREAQKELKANVAAAKLAEAQRHGGQA